MTDTNPPDDRIAEADAAIRAIAATKYHPAPWTSEYDSFGTDINLGPYFQVSDASGHFVAVTESEEVHALLLNAADDINRLSARVEELERQLATAERALEEQRWYGEQLQTSVDSCSGNHLEIEEYPGGGSDEH